MDEWVKHRTFTQESCTIFLLFYSVCSHSFVFCCFTTQLLGLSNTTTWLGLGNTITWLGLGNKTT